MKNKKIIIIAIVIILGALIIYALLTRPDGERVLDKDKEELIAVTNYNEYLSINKLINDYLLNLSLDNEEAVKGVTGNDILITNAKEKDTYYLEKLQYVELTYNIYYYLSGRKMIYDYDTSKMTELKNDCYLVNVYKPNNTYKITKINDVNTYFNDNDLYDKVVIISNEYNDYSLYETSYNDEIIYNNYINYFKDLLFVNYSDAYNLLEVSYINKVGSLDNFNTLRESLYKELNSIVKYYNINGEGPNRTYTIILYNGTQITIIENGIMNVKFKIEN